MTVQAGDGGPSRAVAGTRACARADVVWLNDGPRDRVGDDAPGRSGGPGRTGSTMGFALDGFDEALQLTRYPAEVAGSTTGTSIAGRPGLTARRKLSISIQLSPPESYEDGALELNVDGHVVAAPRALGTAILFPSFALHRVAPVTAGVRHALVTWIHGPDFV